jgi:hypothetical protein
MYAGVSGGLGQMAIGIFLLRGQGLALMAGIVIAGISAAVNSQLAAILAILGDPLDRSRLPHRLGHRLSPGFPGRMLGLWPGPS